MLRTFSSYKTPVIPAGGAIVQPVTGSEFLCVECTAPFYLSANGGESFLMKRGRRFSLPEGELFTTLTFSNPTASALTVQYYAGTMSVRDDAQTFVQFSPTLIVGNGGDEGTVYLDSDGTILLSSTQYINLPGVTASGQRRKQVIITNLDAALDIRVRKNNTANRSIATIFPRTAWTLETDAALAVHNHNGSDVHCQILETFYTDVYDSTSD